MIFKAFYKRIISSSCFVCCLFQANATNVPLNIISPHVEADTLQENIRLLIDTTRKWTIDSIEHRTFQAFDFSAGVPFNPYHNFWFKFSLQNGSGIDSLDALLCFGNTPKLSKIHLHTIEKRRVHLRAGEYLAVHKRAFRPNELCFPIKINPSDKQDYFLQIYDFGKKKAEIIPFIVKSYQQEAIERNIHHAKNLPNYIFFGIFSGTIFILFFYAAFQFKVNWDKAFLFYALYLLSIYIYNLKNFESDIHWPFPFFFAYFMDLKRVLEVGLEHIGYILYILFIQHFLNLSQNSPKINKYLTISIWCLAAYILLDYLFQMIFGIRTSITIHHYVRSLFFIPAFALVYHIFFQQKNKLYQYIFVGTVILLLSSFYTLIGQLFPVEKQFYLGGAIKGYSLWGYQVYMYQMKVGLLLEMICFGFGLSYKNSQQWKNYLSLNEKIKEQNQQIKKFTSTPTENKFSEGELLQKIAILLEENFANASFGTQELADFLLMSRSKLVRQLKKRNQPPPSHLIRQFRLEKARNLILTTDLTLAEIAYKTGFNEAGHFSKVFKDFYGIPPSALRLPQ